MAGKWINFGFLTTRNFFFQFRLLGRPTSELKNEDIFTLSIIFSKKSVQHYCTQSRSVTSLCVCKCISVTLEYNGRGVIRLEYNAVEVLIGESFVYQKCSIGGHRNVKHSCDIQCNLNCYSALFVILIIFFIELIDNIYTP